MLHRVAAYVGHSKLVTYKGSFSVMMVYGSYLCRQYTTRQLGFEKEKKAAYIVCTVLLNRIFTVSSLSIKTKD